jgi:hypothetical protein
MKLQGYFSLITLAAACFFFIPGNAYGDNHNDRNKRDNRKKEDYQNKHSSNKNDNRYQDNKGDNRNYEDNNRKQQGNVQNEQGRVVSRKPNVQQNKGYEQKNRPPVQYNNNYVHFNGAPTKYQYRGKYRNFRNYNHTNRYYYGGHYYNFDDYWRYYSRENDNYYTYEGAYRRHGNFFIFTDRYGNEFVLYLKPIKRAPLWYHVVPVSYGRNYYIKLRPERYYPTPDEISLGLNLNFGWGNISFQNTKYIDVQSAPELINVKGRLYIRE